MGTMRRCHLVYLAFAFYFGPARAQSDVNMAARWIDAPMREAKTGSEMFGDKSTDRGLGEGQVQCEDVAQQTIALQERSRVCADQAAL